MAAPLADLYAAMCRARAFERVIGELWRRGLVSGEMHLGIGEEGVAVGVVTALEDGDALCLDYRSTPPLVARGLPLEPLLLELLGHEQGLCHGRAGHLHLMSEEHLVAASGIVGAPAPLANGFALAAQAARQRRVAVAFFGDGAVNEGMVGEALNLSAVWRLPVVHVCKDNRWAVTTRSRALTGGGLGRRLRAYGMPVHQVDGADVTAVAMTAAHAVAAARAGRPSVVLARCERPSGHFLGDPLVRLGRAAGELAHEVGPLSRQLAVEPGAPLPARVMAMGDVTRKVALAAVDRTRRRSDPLHRAARRLPPDVVRRTSGSARAELEQASARALATAGLLAP